MVAKLIFYYIYYAIRYYLPPWRFFQINVEYFNSKKGYYSKLDIDKHIPPKWRLEQNYFNKNKPPKKFPIFIKPEWGQNSNGVVFISCLNDFLKFSEKTKIPRIVQQVAYEKVEYEIFFILDENNKDYAILTITQVENSSDDSYPINSIKNPHVIYTDITNQFSSDELLLLKSNLQQLPAFRICRIGLRANSKQDLINGLFHIIEINLFAPLPINLLDKIVDLKTKNKFIKDSMLALVKINKTVPKSNFKNVIFIRKVIKHYQSKNEENHI